MFSDLAKQQVHEAEHGENKLGMVRLSIGYLRNSSVVEVTIIQGMNLPGLDKSGVCVCVRACVHAYVYVCVCVCVYIHACTLTHSSLFQD